MEQGFQLMILQGLGEGGGERLCDRSICVLFLGHEDPDADQSCSGSQGSEAQFKLLASCGKVSIL